MFTRRTLIGAGGLAALGTVAGCSGGKSNGASGGGVQLSVIWWGDANTAKQFNQVLNLYGKIDHPNNAKGQFLAWGDYWDKLATLAAAKKMPDVMAFNGDNLPKYAKNGLLMELPKVDLGDYDTSGLSTGKYDGKLYGINFATEYVVLMYNQKMAEGTGVAVPPDGSSWDDWATYFADMQRHLKTGVYASDDLSPNGNVFLSWLIGRGKQGIWNADGSMGYDRDDAYSWFSYWANLRSRKIVPPGPQTVAAGQAGGGPANNPTTKGTAVYTSDTITNFPANQSVNPHKMSLASCPVGPARRGEWHSFYGWTVSAKAPVDAIKEFLHVWFTNPKAWKAIGFSNGIPVSQKALDLLSEDATGPAKTILQFLDKKYPIKPVPIPGAPATLGSNFDTAFSQANDAILSGSSSVDAAVKQFMNDSEQAFG